MAKLDYPLEDLTEALEISEDTRLTSADPGLADMIDDFGKALQLKKSNRTLLIIRGDRRRCA